MDESKWYTSLIQNGGSLASGLGNLLAGARGNTNAPTNNTTNNAPPPASAPTTSEKSNMGLYIGFGVAGVAVLGMVMFFALKK